MHVFETRLDVAENRDSEETVSEEACGIPAGLADCCKKALLITTN
jgi:hypothetical protein